MLLQSLECNSTSRSKSLITDFEIFYQILFYKFQVGAYFHLIVDCSSSSIDCSTVFGRFIYRMALSSSNFITLVDCSLLSIDCYLNNRVPQLIPKFFVRSNSDISRILLSSNRLMMINRIEQSSSKLSVRSNNNISQVTANTHQLIVHTQNLRKLPMSGFTIHQSTDISISIFSRLKTYFA